MGDGNINRKRAMGEGKGAMGDENINTTEGRKDGKMIAPPTVERLQ